MKAIAMPKAIAKMMATSVERSRKLRRQETGSFRKVVSKNDMRPLRVEYTNPGESALKAPTIFKQMQNLELQSMGGYDFERENAPSANHGSIKNVPTKNGTIRAGTKKGSAYHIERPGLKINTGYGKRDSTDSMLPSIKQGYQKKGSMKSFMGGAGGEEAKKIFASKHAQNGIIKMSHVGGEFEPKKASQFIRD